jgi:hypothetical protein
MKGIIGLAIIVFSTITGLMFILSLLSGYVQILQGDVANGTEAIVNATADEIVGSVQWSVVVTVLVAIASALGLTGVVAFMKKI